MTILQLWREVQTPLISSLATVLYTVVVARLGAAWKDHSWRQTLTDHLGTITKQEMDKRDATIAKLSLELATEKRHTEHIRVKVKAMAMLSTKQIEIAGNTYSAINRETGK